MSFNPQNPNGQAASTNSAPVVLASDQSTIPVSATIASLPVDTLTKTSTLANSSGDTSLVTPGAGQSVRVYFFGYSASPANTTTVLCALRFGSNTPFDNQYLAAGQPYARNIGAGRKYVQGQPNEALVVNLSSTQAVYCNIEYALV